MKFLIVDDNDLKAKKVENCLSEHEIVRAKSYRSCLLSILNEDFDGVILDMGLPMYDDGHGLESDQGLFILSEMERIKKRIPTIIHSTNKFDVSAFEFVKDYILADYNVSIDRQINEFINCLK